MKLRYLVILLATFSCVWATQSSAEPTEGKEYQCIEVYDCKGTYEKPDPSLLVNEDVLTEKKVEVVELFWYTCPHCADLEENKYMNAWRKSKADYIEFTQMPAVFSDKHLQLAYAKAYYAAQALGILSKVHGKIFDEIHKKGTRIQSEAQLIELFAKYGEVEPADFETKYKSFSVNTQANKANGHTISYAVNGVPAMIVQGKYRLSATTAGGYENLFKVVDYLAEKEYKVLTTPEVSVAADSN